MRYIIPVTLLSFLAVAYLSFLVGIKTNDNRYKRSFTKAAQSLDQEMTEEEMQRLMIKMALYVTEWDVYGLQRQNDDIQARLMMAIYSMLNEGNFEKAKHFSGSMMSGYLLREDEDADQELQEKIRETLEDYPIPQEANQSIEGQPIQPPRD